MEEWLKTFLGNMADVITGNAALLYIANTCVSVSVVIVFLLLVRGLFMKKLPRIGMYVLWFAVLIRIVCPFTVHGIYSILPERVEKIAARTGHGWTVEQAVLRSETDNREEIYGGSKNSFRLPYQIEVGLLQEKNEPVGQGVRENPDDPKGAVGNMGALPAVEAQKTEKTAVRLEPAKSVRSVRRENKEEVPYIPRGEVFWLLVLWGAGVFLCLSYEAVSMLRTRWRFRDAKQVCGNVYTHPLVYGSFVAGVGSPKIYVSEQLKGEEWEYILRHERVHIRRRDYLLKPLAYSLFSLLWFNPLVWIAYYFMMRDMEVSCDESVIRDLSADERKKYSYLLLALARGLNMPRYTPAFSIGEVQERICNVARYKKPTGFVTALAVVSVILCSCGVVSTPEATKQQMAVPEKKKLYMEQDMQLGESFKVPWSSKYDARPEKEFVVDPQGQFVCFRMLYTRSDKKEKEIHFMKCIGTDGEYQEPSWNQEYQKRFPNAKYWLERYKYGADGYLYLYVAEYSMDRFQYRYEYFERPDIPFERVKNHLLKVDEQTGEVVEITLPEQEKHLADRSGTAANFIPGVRRLEFAVSLDGNICLTEEGGSEGVVYDASGHKLSEITWENRRSDVFGGRGFWAYVSKNHSTNRMDVKVLDEDGDYLYAIPTEVEDDGSKFVNIALGTSEDVILMVCGEGIFEAKLNEKKFRYIAGHKTDQFYCLWPDYYGLAVSSIYKGNQEDYFVGMRNTWEFSDGEFAPGDEPDLWDSLWMYHYTRVGEALSSEQDAD